jgi:hypothetical protein
MFIFICSCSPTHKITSKITNFCNNKKKTNKKKHKILISPIGCEKQVFFHPSPNKTMTSNQIQIQVALAIRIHSPTIIPCYSFALLISFSFSHMHLSMYKIHIGFFRHLELTPQIGEVILPTFYPNGHHKFRSIKIYPHFSTLYMNWISYLLLKIIATRPQLRKVFGQVNQPPNTL